MTIIITVTYPINLAGDIRAAITSEAAIARGLGVSIAYRPIKVDKVRGEVRINVERTGPEASEVYEIKKLISKLKRPGVIIRRTGSL